MNSRKEGVGITQLCRVDQRPPSSGMGGRPTKFNGNAYILRNASSKPDLQTFKMVKATVGLMVQNYAPLLHR
jgi:hypothetical protein